MREERDAVVAIMLNIKCSAMDFSFHKNNRTLLTCPLIFCWLTFTASELEVKEKYIIIIIKIKIE